MKKLNKLQIKSEKIIKKDELLALRGGYGTCTCDCYNWEYQYLGSVESDVLHCNPDCLAKYEHGFGHWNC